MRTAGPALLTAPGNSRRLSLGHQAIGIVDGEPGYLPAFQSGRHQKPPRRLTAIGGMLLN
jgi:hypothetical protein